jgi:hypothetical protein
MCCDPAGWCDQSEDCLDDKKEIEQFIVRHDGTANLYYGLNRQGARPQTQE